MIDNSENQLPNEISLIHTEILYLNFSTKNEIDQLQFSVNSHFPIINSLCKDLDRLELIDKLQEILDGVI